MPSPPGSADLHPLLAGIAGHARARPDAAALILGGVSLSYADLWRRAREAADALLEQGLAPGDRVALSGERKARQFVDLLAILIAGGIYVPLGEKAPAARRARILADCGARFLLPAADEDGPAPAPLQDRLHDRPSPAPLPAGYILYTSGSTGAPKGVRITLDNILAYVGNVRAIYPPAAEARAAQIADLGFDASVHEIFGAWLAGAALCVVPAPHVLMWPRYFRELAIGTALLVPSQVRLAEEAGLLRPGALPDLRQVFLGAELVTGRIVRLLKAAAPNAEIVNLWGPTEGTVALTHHRIARVPPDHEGVPIGRPWAGQRVMLDGDEDGTGELIAAGSQLFGGYWNLPDAGRFLERDGVTFYRTGDLARRTADGAFAFVGRRDRQVKIKGHRIELEECERAIRAHAGTDAAFVVADGDGLTCFIQEGVALDRLGAMLRADLPAYMIPRRFLAISSFPLTASGKVDLETLRATPPKV